MSDPYAAFAKLTQVPAPARPQTDDPYASFSAPVEASQDAAPEANAEPTPSLMDRASILGKSLLSQAENIFHGAAQGTDPNPGNRPSLGNVTAQDDAGNYYFKGPDGQQVKVDLSKQNLLRDASGNLAVYAHDPEHDESGLKSAGRIITQGLVTSPITGPAQSAAINLPQAAHAAEAASEATNDLAAFQRAGVAPPPGAFSSGPTRGLIKSIGETPVIGTPIDRGIENTYTGLRRAADTAAGNLSEATTPREAGQTIETAIERFRDARPNDVIEDGLRLPANATPEQLADSNRTLQEIIAAPASDTSLKTKQAALYERAWRSIPQDMQGGRSVQDAPRVMQNPVNTRRVLQEITARNGRMVQRSGPNAVGDAELSPVRGGLLGRMVEAVRNPNWSANLQTLRDMRSSLRRLASGMPDTERNVLSSADIARLQSGLSMDMIQLLARNAERYKQAGDLQKAESFNRAIRQFHQADKFTRLSMERLDTIEKLFKASGPEALARSVTNSALAGGKGNFDMLRTLSRTLRPEEMNDVRASIFNEMFKPVASARGMPQATGFSAQSFLTRWRGMSDEAKSLLFPGEHGKAIDDIARMSSRLANVESMSNVSRSGANAVNVTGLLGGIASVAHGDVMTPLAILGGGTAASFLLSRPLYAQWAARLMDLKAASIAAPGRFNAEIASHLNRGFELARKDPELAPFIQAIARENGIEQGNTKKQKPDETGRPPQPQPEQPQEQNGSLPRPHASLGSMFGFVSPAEAGEIGSPTPNLPGIPFGEDGSKTPDSATAARMRAEADAKPLTASDIGDAALNALHTAGDVSLALGPAGEAISGGTQALGSLIRSLGASGRGTTAAIIGERALTKPTAEQTIAGLRSEIDDLIARGKNLGVTPGPMPSAATPESEINLLTSVRDSMKSRLAEKQAAVDARTAAAPTTSVPAADARPAMNERAEIADAIAANPYTQAIPGRQGFPTKKAQADLANQFFEQGGRLEPAGPWGRDIPQAVRDVMTRAVRPQSTGEPASLPDINDLVKGYKKLSQQVAQMHEDIVTHSGNYKGMKQQLQEANQALLELHKLILKRGGGQ